MAREMTAKQKRFCDEYLISLNATQAAIKAGYSQKTATAIGLENLTKPAIKDYIKMRMDEKESELIADQDEVLRYFTAVMRGQSQAEIVVVENTGDFKSKAKKIFKTPDEKERLDAAKQLAKRYGLDSEEAEKQAKIEKLKAEIARLKGESPDDSKADDGFLEALQSEVQNIWEEP